MERSGPTALRSGARDRDAERGAPGNETLADSSDEQPERRDEARGEHGNTQDGDGNRDEVLLFAPAREVLGQFPVGARGGWRGRRRPRLRRDSAPRRHCAGRRGGPPRRRCNRAAPFSFRTGSL